VAGVSDPGYSCDSEPAPPEAGELKAYVPMFGFRRACGRTFFLDTSSAFLTKRFVKEMSKRPEMRRYGAALAPRVRGYCESISPATAGKLEQARGRDTSGKAKTMKEN